MSEQNTCITPQTITIRIKIKTPTTIKIQPTIKTYHHNPSPQLVEILSYFASVHRYDERKTFKEEWKKWIELPAIQPIIQEECERLKHNGYDGDTMDKIFKSVRYYYRKKTPTQIDADGVPVPPEKKPRKKYEGLDEAVLEQMDAHIQELMDQYLDSIDDQELQKHNHVLCLLPPAEAFSDYTKQNAEQYAELDEAQQLKIKKTYKNRFFKKREILIKQISFLSDPIQR
jgi:hypothetical protein